MADQTQVVGGNLPDEEDDTVWEDIDDDDDSDGSVGENDVDFGDHDHDDGGGDDGDDYYYVLNDQYTIDAAERERTAYSSLVIACQRGHYAAACRSLEVCMVIHPEISPNPSHDCRIPTKQY